MTFSCLNSKNRAGNFYFQQKWRSLFLPRRSSYKTMNIIPQMQAGSEKLEEHKLPSDTETWGTAWQWVLSYLLCMSWLEFHRSIKSQINKKHKTNKFVFPYAKVCKLCSLKQKPFWHWWPTPAKNKWNSNKVLLLPQCQLFPSTS